MTSEDRTRLGKLQDEYSNLTEEYLRSVVSWMMNRQRYVLVCDDFGHQFVIHEGKEDEWYDFIREPVGPLPEWARCVAGEDVVFYLQ